MADPFKTIIKTPDGDIEVDATLSVGPEHEVKVTEHPIERGSIIADHANVQPDVVKIEGIIGESAIATPLIAGRADAAHAKLTGLKNSAQLVTVVTRRQTYVDMILTSLSFPMDEKTGDALRFTASFRKVRQVETRLVKVKPRARTNTNRNPPVNQGNQTAKPAPEAVAKKSLWKDVSKKETWTEAAKIFTGGAS